MKNTEKRGVGVSPNADIADKERRRGVRPYSDNH